MQRRRFRSFFRLGRGHTSGDAVITFERGAMNDAENYLLRYMRLTSQPSFEGLVMGVKIARARNDPGAEQSYLQQLRRRFPDAPETAELQEKPR